MFVRSWVEIVSDSSCDLTQAEGNNKWANCCNEAVPTHRMRWNLNLSLDNRYHGADQDDQTNIEEAVLKDRFVEPSHCHLHSTAEPVWR